MHHFPVILKDDYLGPYLVHYCYPCDDSEQDAVHFVKVPVSPFYYHSSRYYCALFIDPHAFMRCVLHHYEVHSTQFFQVSSSEAGRITESNLGQCHLYCEHCPFKLFTQIQLSRTGSSIFVYLLQPQMFRCAMPVFTCVLEFIIYGKVRSLLVYLSLIPVILGTMLVCLGDVVSSTYANR